MHILPLQSPLLLRRGLRGAASKRPESTHKADFYYTGVAEHGPHHAYVAKLAFLLKHGDSNIALQAMKATMETLKDKNPDGNILEDLHQLRYVMMMAPGPGVETIEC